MESEPNKTEAAGLENQPKMLSGFDEQKHQLELMRMFLGRLEHLEAKVLESNLVRDQQPNAANVSGESQSPTWKVELEKFAGSTTMHGAPQMILSKHPLKKLAWIAIFFASWVMFIWQTVLVCNNYFEYPIRTEVQIAPGVPFPAVTFCPHGVVSFYDYANWKSGEVEQPLYVSLIAVEVFNKAHHSFRSRLMNSYLEKYYVPMEELFFSLKGRFKNKTNEDDTIEFADLDVERVEGGQFFKCYRVQIPERFDEFQVSELYGDLVSGGFSTLEARGWTSLYDYAWLSYNRGPVRVFVHQHGTVVDPRTNPYYVDIHPSSRVQFSVKAKHTVRLGLPHGNCSKNNPFRCNQSEAYQRNECLGLCYNDQLMKQQNKLSALHPMLDDLVCREEPWHRGIRFSYNPDGLFDSGLVMHRCNKSVEDLKDKTGSFPVLIERPSGFTFNPDLCRCYPPCDEIEYEVHSDSENNRLDTDIFQKKDVIKLRGHEVRTNYSGRFRSGIHEIRNSNGTFELHNITGGNDKKFKFTDNYIRTAEGKAMSGFVSFSIRIGDDKIPSTMETPLYTRAQLISEIGGQLGIWIGVSVITLTEVVELLVSIVCKCLNRRRNSELKEGKPTMDA